MLIYLDNCCFNRPFDDQRYLSINLETQAKIFVQQEILSGQLKLLWSYILEHENNRNPFDIRRDTISEWKNIAYKTILESEEVLSFGETLMMQNVKLYDALHIACAYVGKCDYFLTVDKNLLNKNINSINICSPIDFIHKLEV